MAVNTHYIEGFGHLNNLVVQIIIGGVIHPDRIVGNESADGAADGAPGRIYVERIGSVAVVGLEYVPELETLDLDDGVATGSAAVHKKRRNKIAVKVLNSGLPLINGVRYNDRNTTTPMDTISPLISGDIEITNLGWDKKAVVNIKQNLPLPLIILSINGEVVKNTL